jgi:hypothetical protein
MPDLLGGEPLPRHHLEDCPRWTDADAFAAPGAAGAVGVAVRAHDDLGMLAAEADIQHADDLNILARPHAAGAQDAGRHVVPDHRVTGALVARTQRQIASVDRRRHDVVLHQVALELVARLRTPAVAQMLGGIALGEQAEHAFPVFDCGVRLGRHDHAVGDFGRARREEFGLAFDGNKTDPAVAHDGQGGVPAQRRDLEGGCARGIEDCCPLVRGHAAPVDFQARHTSYK